MSKSVSTQITDGITQTSSHVLGLGPATAAVNAYLGQTQALSVLLANMVNQQQQQAIVGLSVTTRNVTKLLTVKPPVKKAATQQTSLYQQTQYHTPEPHRPVVT
ncbi:MAG: RebB family R body protein [Methylobacter sp.]